MNLPMRTPPIDPLADTQPLPILGDTLRMQPIELEATMPIEFGAQERSWFEEGDASSVPVAAVERECRGAAPYLIALAAAVLPLVLSFA